MNDDKVPPQNIEAEESIIGGILLDPKAMARIADILPADAFYVTAHQHIYSSALALHLSDLPIDLMTVTSLLSDQKLLHRIGGHSRLAQLVERTVSATNIDRYAQLVLGKYKRRQLIDTGTKLIELAHDTTQELDDLFDQSEKKLFDVTNRQTDRFKPEAIGDCLVEVWNKLDEGEPPALSTSLADLDKLIGGLVKEDLIVIAARASMGKTWLGCYLANHVAMTYQLPVVFFSAEMGREQLTKRFLSMHSQVDSHRLIHNKIYKSEMDTLSKALGVLVKMPIIIDDTPAGILTPSRMKSALRRIQAERGSIGLIVMDYIQKLGDRAAGNRAQAVGKYSGAFKDIAKEFGCPFVALAQINRGVESQANKRPTMADIKDSGDIEQDMDLGLLLYRDEYYDAHTKDKGVMEINVAKNRNGATGICRVLFNPAWGEFKNLAVGGC